MSFGCRRDLVRLTLIVMGPYFIGATGRAGASRSGGTHRRRPRPLRRRCREGDGKVTQTGPGEVTKRRLGKTASIPSPICGPVYTP